MSLPLSHRIHNRLLQSVVDSFGDPMDIRLRLQQGDSEFFTLIAREVDRTFSRTIQDVDRGTSDEEKADLDRAIHDSMFCRRIKDAVLEDVYGERLCPQLTILPGSLSSSDSRHPAAALASIDETSVHAVCFECLPNICNELYPLAIDSYVCDLAKHWRRNRCTIGVRVDWLDDGLRAKRCIYYLPESDESIETDLVDPLRIDSVHFLAITPGCHATWSKRFLDKKIFQLNPYECSALADDKYACCQLWEKDGIPTPPAMLLNRTAIPDGGVLEDRLQGIVNDLFCEEFGDEIVLIVQPNRGTEGRGAQAYTGSKNWAMFLQRNPMIIDHVRVIARTDDVLFRKGIHNVLLNDPGSGKDVCFDIRANVSLGRLESGFFMVAAPGNVVASPGRGGHILEWRLGAEWRIRIPGQNGLIALDDIHWREIQQVAESAVARFPNCRIAGVDIRLHWRNGTIVSNVLDINPRPAGMAHSRYLDTREPGVTQLLWDVLPDAAGSVRG